LIFQFLGEAVIMTSLAVALALVAGRLALPWFNKLVEVPLDLPWNNSNFWLAILAATMIVSLIAGSYPALFLSGFHPAQTLKNHIHNNRQSGYIRSGLVTFQFLIAIVLIIGTLLIYQQLRYIQSKELGFQKEQIIVLNDAFTLNENISAFKESMMQSPLIEAASVSSYLPTPSSRSNSTYSKVRELRQDQLINMAEWYVDHDYLSTFELEMKEGRFFSRDFPGDSTAVIVNETAAAIIGYEHPIGEKIYGLAGNPDGAPKPEDFDEFTIIGVVKDFHFESLKENIGSLAFFLGQANGLISFRFQPEETGQVVSLLESNWRRMAPDQPFSYRFVDEEFDRIYEAEQRIGKISLIFAILAIIVSCLGLFGLSTFVVEQRMKEIGIRKILGSSASGIVRLLAGSFIQLVLLAFVLAIPVTIYLMKQWLQNFAYRIDIHWSVFVYAGLTAIMIAFATICFQSIRAAVANPVNALRSD